MAVSRGRADEGKVVICILQLGVIGIHLVDEERYGFVLFVTLN